MVCAYCIGLSTGVAPDAVVVQFCIMDEKHPVDVGSNSLLQSGYTFWYFDKKAAGEVSLSMMGDGGW